MYTSAAIKTITRTEQHTIIIIITRFDIIIPRIMRVTNMLKEGKEFLVVRPMYFANRHLKKISITIIKYAKKKKFEFF